MEKYLKPKQIISQLLVMMMFTSCVAPDAAREGDLATAGNATTAGSTGGGGNNATGDSPTDLAESALPPKVELRHLIEPNLATDTNYNTGTGYAGGGSYVRKLTLPKNFAGRLYLAGVNVGTLTNRFVKVRFRFGVGRTAIADIPATVVQAPGITPQTPISVLVLDLRSEPFRDVRLNYDLFDYNDYDFSDADTAPVQDNRDSGLYCRGLKVEDDPTFAGVGACDGLQVGSGQPAEECLYAYAKVMDQGLIKESNSILVPLAPSLAQSKSLTGGSYFQDYFTYQLRKPLADTIPTSAAHTISTVKFSELAVPANSTDSKAVTFGVSPASVWGPAVINNVNYYYRGPYRLVNTPEWQFKFASLDGPGRLFKSGSYVDYPIYLTNPLPDDNENLPTQNKLYYNSYMFPLATKIDLPANVTHLSSTDVEDERTVHSLTTQGKTLWMDGANARANSINSELNHVGSCNVSSSIEILATDDNGVEYIITSSKDVKLQLVRPTQYRTDTGNEVLYTNFKTCSTNASCGGSECCFNNRCWDESLVSQCVEATSTQGNRIVGDSCVSDLECNSFCCNSTSGTCSPHNTSLDPAVLCAKPTGQFCIAKEWCGKSPITKWLVVKTGNTCTQRSYTTMEYGDCKNGTCSPPVQGAQPAWTPGDCSAAVTPPSF